MFLPLGSWLLSLLLLVLLQQEKLIHQLICRWRLAACLLHGCNRGRLACWRRGRRHCRRLPLLLALPLALMLLLLLLLLRIQLIRLPCRLALLQSKQLVHQLLS